MLIGDQGERRVPCQLPYPLRIILLKLTRCVLTYLWCRLQQFAASGQGLEPLIVITADLLGVFNGSQPRAARQRLGYSVFIAQGPNPLTLPYWEASGSVQFQGELQWLAFRFNQSPKHPALWVRV